MTGAGESCAWWPSMCETAAGHCPSGRNGTQGRGLPTLIAENHFLPIESWGFMGRKWFSARK